MRPPARGGAPQGGFTLLEMLIAIVVLGFVLAGLVQAARFGVGAWNFQSRIIEQTAERERVDHVLRLLIEQATPPLAADDKPFAGEAHRIQFITRLPDAPPTDPVRRAQVALGVDQQHRLILRWQPHPNAVALQPVPPPQQIILAEGIDHFDVSYRQSAGDGGRWKTDWDDPALPSLVTMHIVPLNQHTHWPVIIAAPALDANGSF